MTFSEPLSVILMFFGVVYLGEIVFNLKTKYLLPFLLRRPYKSRLEREWEMYQSYITKIEDLHSNEKSILWSRISNLQEEKQQLAKNSEDTYKMLMKKAFFNE